MIGFAEFLRLVYDDEERVPYPWQQRLADRCRDESPPAVIALPTGSGKTTAIDALVWALACQARRPAAQRTVGVRIVWAIDRRILVDDVYAHACALAERLGRALAADDDPLHELAASLAHLSGGPPLVATRWRGGLEEAPERHGPLQPQIITSTVAQIGSRLLFRGYGVGVRSLALEAGLAAYDTTICLDEAHLSEPFRRTVAAVGCLQRERERELALPGPRVLTITATPSSDNEDAIELQDDDRAALGPCWNGEKVAVLVEPASTRDADCVAALAAATVGHVEDGAQTVACIVNTVRRAREVFAVLQRKLKDAGAEAMLLIGPQRPADRELILSPDRRGVLFHGESPATPLVVVATQTFEVGLDADVAAMVTESASAAALVQRLGRLYRNGRPKHGVSSGCATVVRDEGGWLYKEDEPSAWEWLRSRARSDSTIDVSVAALYEDRERPRRARMPFPPTLTDEIAELFVQTSPRPHRWAEPDVEAFLRGAEADPNADVGLCWRSDLRFDLRDKEADGYREMLLKLVPPHRRELLTLSVSAAKGLLTARFHHSTAAARAALAETDVEGERTDSRYAEPDEPKAGTDFMIVRHGEVRPGTLGHDPQAVRLADIAPGDTVVLGTEIGGVDEHGLAPDPLRRASQATDVAPDLRPDDLAPWPSSVRLTPQALGENVEGGRSRLPWDWIEARCDETERYLLQSHLSTEKRAAKLNGLVTELHERLPDHAGLARLAQLGLQPGRLVLRSVGPMDDDGVPQLTEHELEEDVDDDTPHEDDGGAERAPGGDDDSQGSGEEHLPHAAAHGGRRWRTWVLAVVPRGRRDWAHRGEATEGQPPTLDAHARAVQAEVTSYAEKLGLTPAIRGSLELAARVHDHGKADRRVQAFYRYGADSLGAAPIAKSEFGTHDPRAEALARDRAGLPRKLRHELGSVRVLASALEVRSLAVNGVDLDLALHLTGTHHGQCHPIPPVPLGGAPPRPFRVEAAGIAGGALGDGLDGWEDGAWLERFWTLVGRYGAWALAYLEALLISADRAVSARGGD